MLVGWCVGGLVGLVGCFCFVTPSWWFGFGFDALVLCRGNWTNANLMLFDCLLVCLFGWLVWLVARSLSRSVGWSLLLFWLFCFGQFLCVCLFEGTPKVMTFIYRPTKRGTNSKERRAAPLRGGGWKGDAEPKSGKRGAAAGRDLPMVPAVARTIGLSWALGVCVIFGLFFLEGGGGR